MSRFILLCAKPLRYIYQNKGLGEELFIDTMMDAKYKLMECKAVHNIWGTFVLTWFKGFFTLDRFKLGRLQFNFEEFRENEHYAVDVGLKNGDKVKIVEIQR